MNQININFNNEDIFNAFCEFNATNIDSTIEIVDNFDKFFKNLLKFLDESGKLEIFYGKSIDKSNFYKCVMQSLKESIDDYFYLNFYQVDNKLDLKRKIDIDDVSIYDNKCLMKSKDNNLLIFNYD
jgi:hypothetical protein